VTDLDFLAGRFIDYEIPPEKRYLRWYFSTDLQTAFLRYRLLLEESPAISNKRTVVNFTNHTGYYCSQRVLWAMMARYKHLTELHAKAKKTLTEEGMETLTALETGRYISPDCISAPNK
jgi:hypothetical protein